MRGSVIKKGDRWYVKIELDVDPATGRRRQKWHSGFNTKREAERARVDLLSKFDRGEYVEPTHQTVASFMADWLRALEPTIRASTFESYERNVRNHVVANIGATRLTKVDAGVLNGLYALLLSSGRMSSSRKGKGYEPEVVTRALALRAKGLTLVATAEQLRGEFTSAEHITKDTLASLLRRQASKAAERPAGLDPRTVNYIHTIIHSAFKDAVRWGRLARNPADASDPPTGGQKSDGIQAWDAATLRWFLDESRKRGDRLHALWVLLATTGMRRGEALGLRWRDVDLDAGRLRVVQTLIQTRGNASISEPKTARGRRPISLDKATVAVLREHRKQMLKERLLVGPDFNDSGLVFHRPDGSRLKPDAVSATFLRRVESSDVAGLLL
jgi:integrase